MPSFYSKQWIGDNARVEPCVSPGLGARYLFLHPAALTMLSRAQCDSY